MNSIIDLKDCIAASVLFFVSFPRGFPTCNKSAGLAFLRNLRNIYPIVIKKDITIFKIAMSIFIASGVDLIFVER